MIRSFDISSFKNMASWYYHLIPNAERPGVSLFENEKLEGGLIVSRELDKRMFCYFKTHGEFERYLESVTAENRCFYEIVESKTRQKLYFDIDIPWGRLPEGITNEMVISSLELSILKCFPEVQSEDIVVASSHGDSSSSENKRSFHLVVDNWYVESNIFNSLAYGVIMKNIPDEYKSVFDKLYKPHQNFRIYGCHKYKSSRTKIWNRGQATSETDRFLSLFVTYTENCSPLTLKIEPPKVIMPTRDSSTYMVGSKEVFKIMKFFSKTFADHSSFTFKDVFESIVNLRRLRPSFCVACNRIHDNENAMLIVVGVNRSLFFKCRRSEAYNPEGSSIYLGVVGPYEEYIPSSEQISSQVVESSKRSEESALSRLPARNVLLEVSKVAKSMQKKSIPPPPKTNMSRFFAGAFRSN